MMNPQEDEKERGKQSKIQYTADAYLSVINDAMVQEVVGEERKIKEEQEANEGLV